MQRELAFVLQSQSLLTGSLGRTRASKVRLQIGDLDGASGGRSSKRFKASGVSESGSNGETDVLQKKSEVNGSLDQDEKKKVRGGQSNVVVVYRRTRRFKDANSEVEQKASEVERIEAVLEDNNCNCNCNSEVAEASTKEDLVDGSEKVAVSKVGYGVVPMVDEKSNVVRNDEQKEGINDARNGLGTNVSDDVKCAVLVAASSGVSDSGEHENVVDVEVNENCVTSAPGTPAKKLELKMSKKIALGRIPRTVMELFATGFLEGYSVVYNGGIKGFALRGMIKDNGILCFCSLCKGSWVVSPCKFEIHACKSYRRASQYICLENGKSLLEVLKACRKSPLDTLEETIHSFIGPLPEKEFIICQNCKASFLAAFPEKVDQLCQSCVDLKNIEATRLAPTSPSDTTDRSVKPVLALGKSAKISQEVISSLDSQRRITKARSLKPALPTRSGSSWILSQRKSEGNIIEKSLKPELASKSSDGSAVQILSHKKSQERMTQNSRPPLDSKLTASTSVGKSSKSKFRGKITKKSSKAVLIPRPAKIASLCVSQEKKSKWKITKKDQRLHKLVFEDGGLPDGTEVAYFCRGQKLRVGYKRGLGIFCHCCNTEVSPSQFEAHAGCASNKKPYSYIYTSNGVSLHEFAVSLLKDDKHSRKDNDDLCIICADGGNLLLCDGCPRAFHKECASLSSVPHGKWYCQYCQNMFQREKFLGYNANALAAGRVSGVDPIEQITKRCIRIVEVPVDAEVIACVLCRGSDFRKSGFGPRTVIVCDQCEKEYHVGCLKKQKMAELEELPKGKWFCCMDCRRIYSALQNLIVHAEEKIPSSLLGAIKKKRKDNVAETFSDFDVRWRLLSGKIASPETRLFLSKAVAIFHDCFDPIIDSATGRDYISSMVYGRSIKGKDFGGMYCAVLTVNSSVVSAGIFRVFGQEIAELPLVATSSCNRGKGYFQILFSCIEKLLAFLKVRCLVLPAADEAESIWVDKFGFEKMSPEQLSDHRKTCWQMLTFEGTNMLQKMVPHCRVIQQDNLDAIVGSS